MRKPRPSPWLPADYTLRDVQALKAIYEGTADAAQQRRALEWIINVAAETYDEPYRSDMDGGERDTSYALGKRSVGLQVVKMINLPPAMVAKLRSEDV